MSRISTITRLGSSLKLYRVRGVNRLDFGVRLHEHLFYGLFKFEHLRLLGAKILPIVSKADPRSWTSGLQMSRDADSFVVHTHDTG